ncbi:MAG: flavin reductase family protein [Lachnospiraceae bacterium]|nr:flavin reductase family protein [Lachnospiraceae bacterium]
MARVSFKPGNMLYPLPVVMVSVADKQGNSNIITVAWAGTICTNPPMVSISVRPERHSYHMIEETGEFVINLTTKDLVYATDYCGVKSGRDVNKWEVLGLTPIAGQVVKAPLIEESPVNIECRVTQVEKLGSHHMFMAEVVAVQVNDKYMDEKNSFHLSNANPIVYSHGEYYLLGEKLGKFGYSIQKKPSAAKKASAGKKAASTKKK